MPVQFEVSDVYVVYGMCLCVPVVERLGLSNSCGLSYLLIRPKLIYNFE